MSFAGRELFFRLSARGKTALEGLVPEGGFTSMVEEQDDRGLWVVRPGQPMEDRAQEIILVKWEYLATASWIKPVGPAGQKGS